MKHAKVQRSPKSLIALVLAIALLVAAIPFTAVAGDVDYYTATLGTLTNHTSTGATPTGSSDANLTNSVSASWVKWYWTDHTAADSNGQVRLNLSGVTAGENDSFLFYVKFPANATATGMAIRVMSDGNKALVKEKPVYLLPKGATEWQPATTDVRTVTSSNQGYIPFAKGFEGWVRVPRTSTTLVADAAIEGLRLYFDNITSDAAYENADDQLSFGALMVVNEADLYKVSFDRGVNTTSLLPKTAYDAIWLDKSGHSPEGGLVAGKNETDESTVAFSMLEEGIVPGNFAGWYKYHFFSKDDVARAYDVANVALTNDIPAIQVNNSKGLTAAKTDTLLMYVSTTATVNTYFTLRLGTSSHYLSCGTNFQGLPYYLRSDVSDTWTTKATVARSATGDKINGTRQTYYGDIELPAGFRGWVAVPVSSFRGTFGGASAGDITANAVHFIATNVGGQYGDITTGAFMLVQDSSLVIENLSTLNFQDADGANQSINMNAATITVPEGLGMNQVYFEGDETVRNEDGSLNEDLYVHVKDIASFVGCKLYYQYTNEEGETVKIALLRAGSAYHGTADAYDEGVNNTAFYIPALKGAKDAKIVADTATGTLSDNATVMGVQAVYYVDEEENVSYIDEKTGKFTFKVTARLAREVVDNGVAYDLKHVKLTVAKEGSTSSKTYDISTLSDRCDKYAEFVKPLSGSDETARYSMVAVGVYEDENGNELTVTSDALTGQSIETVVANDGIITE